MCTKFYPSLIQFGEQMTKRKASDNMEEETTMSNEASKVRSVDDIKTQIGGLLMQFNTGLQELLNAWSHVIDTQPRTKQAKRFRGRNEDHRQTCLRKALQKNIISLVNDLPFTVSELGDMLISTECLTEDECGDLKRRPIKDQTRNLVRLIKGRSFRVMFNFLECVNKISPDITKCVWDTYQENLKDRGLQSACSFCSLRLSVDIKLLADHVFSIEVISDSLYDEIVACDYPGENHWHKMAIECHDSGQPQKAMEAICKALERKGHYEELLARLRRTTKLKCCCSKPETVTTNITESPGACEDDASSHSPKSSSSEDEEDARHKLGTDKPVTP